MENAIVHANIVGYKNDLNKDIESSKEDCLSEILAKRGDVSPSSIKRLQISDFCAQNHFFQQLSGLNKLIPKQIMTMEEKYLRHCLALIHTSAMTANSWPISSSRVVGSGNGGRDALFLFSSGNENLVVSSSVDPIVGSITGSRTMINLLNSPLLRQLGASGDDISNGNASAIEVREPVCVDSSHDIQKKRVLPEDQIFGCSPAHKRLVSHSSTYSTFSDPSTSSSSSSSSSSGYCQGMLHCSWNYGFPRYVFSVEDQREVYTTNLSKADSIRDDSCDYIYSFYSRAGKRENVIHDEESELVGKMRVSTSFTACPQGTDIMETQYILYATGEHSEGGTHTPNQTVKKSKGLSKKVSNIFKGNHIRKRTSSKFDGSVAIQDTSLELNDEGNLFQESSFPSNIELAAIVVKDHIPDSQKKVEVGGWGLKFLKE
ncbi:cadherin EGF LAG seven-pass G-type receptor, partial [Tanacetum coccineum]